MDVDNQSEDGEIKRSPENFSDEEGADTADSLEIKPPQAVVRHRKTNAHRRDEQSGRRERREDKERKSRHHGERLEDGSSRHREKHSSRHRRHSGEIAEKIRRSDPSKRERESIRHERKERSTGDRQLEDLRERLLDKRRERRDDSREYKIEPTSRNRDEPRLMDNRVERREIRVEDLRERREIRLVEEITSRERREARMEARMEARIEARMDEQHQRSSGSHRHLMFQDVEIIDPSRLTQSREKKHKRSHKHERTKDREREIAHREKYAREHTKMEVDDEYELEVLAAKQQQQQHQQQLQQMISLKDPKDMTEQELRRQRLLDADREMARRKEVSRLELEARRKMRGEKRPHSPESNIRDPSVVDLLSDESERAAANSDISSRKSDHSRLSEEMRDPDRNHSDKSSSSSSDSSSEDDDSNDSNKDSDSAENSDYNNPSPISVDQLAKSDRSDLGSPGHVETNGASKNIETKAEKSELELQMELPPYFPAIQGCRSVEEYKCLNRIAEGTYGVVYRAEDRRTKEIVALKRLKMEKEKDGFPITSLREINTLLKAQHPNIVTVREIVVGSNMDKIFIVMDYVEHDLKSLMETMQTKNQYFVPREIKCLMLQLLKAVAHLHDNWILHRDLKTSNLLLSHHGILKVGDFGLAREYGSPLKNYTSIVVTLWYRAPELLLGCKEYSTPIDVWSVGCIFAELLSMKALFPGKSEIDLLNRVFKELGTPNERIWPGYNNLPMVKKIPFATYPVNNLRQRFSMTLSDSGLDLLNKFLTYDPAQRITADDALKHSYFTEPPLPIDPAMFPTWPAKSEFGAKVNASPKPPSGGKEFKQLGDEEDEKDMGFHMGTNEAARQAVGGGFALRF